jgi:hypothetical protein
MKRWWADTLFKRLLLLMWAALVASHLCAFFVVRTFEGWPDAPGRMAIPPVMPALPPGALPGIGPTQPPGGPHAPADARSMEPAPSRAGNRPQPFDFDRLRPPIEPGGMGPSGGLPAMALWLDYAVRWFVIGIAAWFGARWCRPASMTWPSAARRYGWSRPRVTPRPRRSCLRTAPRSTACSPT